MMAFFRRFLSFAWHITAYAIGHEDGGGFFRIIIYLAVVKISCRNKDIHGLGIFVFGMSDINYIAVSTILDHLPIDGLAFFGVVLAGIEVEAVSDLIFAAGAGVSLLMEKELAAFNLQNIAVKRFSPAISDGIALVFPHGRHLSPAAAALRNFLTN
jgi:hypothetical protein